MKSLRSPAPAGLSNLALIVLVMSTILIASGNALGQEAVSGFTLTAKPGQTVSEKVQIEAGQPVTFFTQIDGRSALMFRDESGNFIKPDDDWRMHTSEYNWTEKTSFFSPSGNSITVSLTGWNSEPVTAQVALEFDNGYQIEPAIRSQLWVRGVRQPMAAWMTLNGELIAGARGKFKVRAEFTPGGGEKELTLKEGAVAEFGLAEQGVFGLPLMPNYVQPFHLSFSGETIYNQKFIKRDLEFRYFVKGEETPRFMDYPKVNTLDNDGDGKFDALVIQANVIQKPGTQCTMHARLVDKTGYVIHPDLARGVVNRARPTDHIVTLKVNGEQIVRTGKDGPWSITDIRLWNNDTDALADVFADFATPEFKATDFDPPDPPRVEGIEPQSGGRVRIMGRNVGDTQELFIQNVPVKYAVMGMNELLTLPPTNILPEEWERRMNKIKPSDLYLKSRWGTFGKKSQ
ncbi:MAG: hypothetical protein ACYTHJ_02195 [Planctomycetota bacterium]|jgi:hypothetical protein